MDTYTAAIKQDPKYKKLMLLIRKGAFNVNSTALINELKMIHGNRRSRKLRSKEVIEHAQRDLIAALIDNQKSRSRVAEIKTQVVEIIMSLENYTSRLGRHYRVTYLSQLKASGYTSQAAQQDATKNALSRIYDQIDELKTVQEIANIVVEDIDKSGWNLNAMVNVLALRSQRERNY